MSVIEAQRRCVCRPSTDWRVGHKVCARQVLSRGGRVNGWLEDESQTKGDQQREERRRSEANFRWHRSKRSYHRALIGLGVACICTLPAALCRDSRWGKVGKRTDGLVCRHPTPWPYADADPSPSAKASWSLPRHWLRSRTARRLRSPKAWVLRFYESALGKIGSSAQVQGLASVHTLAVPRHQQCDAESRTPASVAHLETNQHMGGN